MIQAGYSAVELAAELGHSPTLTLDTYADVFSEYARGERLDPEREIEKRERRCSGSSWHGGRTVRDDGAHGPAVSDSR